MLFYSSCKHTVAAFNQHCGFKMTQLRQCHEEDKLGMNKDLTLMKR